MSKLCKIENCSGKHKAKGYCQKHYRRLQRHGDVNEVKCEVGYNNKSHPLYTTWCGMKERCSRPENKAYKYYGGRGIKVCSQWENSFQTFLKDMGEKPSPEYTLDRIDNDADYSPENCQWLSMSEQVKKQGARVNNKTGYKGVHLHNSGYQVSIDKKYIGFSKTLDGAIKILNDYKGKK